MARTAKKDNALTPEEKLAQALVRESEQPYQIPENWCWAKLKSIYEINPKINAEENIAAAFIPMEKISAGTCSEFEFEIQPWGMAKKGHTQFADGDVAFAKISPCFENGKSFIVHGLPNGIGGGTTELIILRQPLMDQRFTYWLISTDDFIKGGCRTYSGTVGQQRINMDYVKKYPVPVPPLAEQQRIVDRIESLFAKLDEAKEKAQAVVDGFEDRKAAISHKAFTGELTAEWRNTHGVSIDDWENAPLETVFQLRSGSTIDASEELEYGAIPYVKVADMNLPENEIQITTSSRFVDECPESHVIPKGSTIFPKRGGAILTNKKRYVGVEKIIADLNTMAIMPIAGRAYGWYGYYWMQSVDLRQLNNGSNVPQINNKDMVKLFVPTPSIDEQKAIVGILDSIFDKEIEAKETAEQVIDQIDSMKKSILARAFRGELGTNDPADESAEELLKRIL